MGRVPWYNTSNTVHLRETTDCQSMHKNHAYIDHSSQEHIPVVRMIRKHMEVQLIGVANKNAEGLAVFLLGLNSNRVV
jgi:hypothetical protein